MGHSASSNYNTLSLNTCFFKDFYDLDTSDWKLRGAAKPAATIGEEAVFNPHERPCGDDNFVKCELIAVCFFLY